MLKIQLYLKFNNYRQIGLQTKYRVIIKSIFHETESCPFDLRSIDDFL